MRILPPLHFTAVPSPPLFKLASRSMPAQPRPDYRLEPSSRSSIPLPSTITAWISALGFTLFLAKKLGSGIYSPVHRNACFKFTHKFVEFLQNEDEVVCGMNDVNVIKIKKIVNMYVNGRVHVHAIRSMRRELGLPENFKDSIIEVHNEIFRMVDLEIVELVDFNDSNGKLDFVPEIEKWREKEYKEKWLSEFEIKYSFPIYFPTGFRISPGFREKLRNWQRLSYVKPYERMENVQICSCGGLESLRSEQWGLFTSFYA